MERYQTHQTHVFRVFNIQLHVIHSSHYKEPAVLLYLCPPATTDKDIKHGQKMMRQHKGLLRYNYGTKWLPGRWAIERQTHRLHETEQGLLVPEPLWVELLFRRELVTAQLHCNLQTVSVEVVKV